MKHDPTPPPGGGRGDYANAGTGERARIVSPLEPMPRIRNFVQKEREMGEGRGEERITLL